ncbi:MAG: polyprenyl synthetase family protein [Acidobacteriota bacterium]
MTLAAHLERGRQQVEQALDRALPARDPDPCRLVEAMRYTLLLPAKRIRGIICLTVAEAFAADPGRVLPLAVAVEMVHAASLILDDLPAFDDAERRRGATTCHRVFGESTAMLASIGLLAAAFRHLARNGRTRWFGADDATRTVAVLAEAVGEDGMVVGEALDLAARGRELTLDQLERIHALKTGSLFIACTAEAARLAGAGPAERNALETYAKNLGLAFQVVDDVLDVAGDPARTGKDAGADREGASFVRFAGVEGARRLAAELVETAVAALAPLGPRGARLGEIARFVLERDR